MIEIVIKIPKEAKQAFDCAESNDLKGGYYDHGGVIGEAIRNGTPLPEHHGRIIDESKITSVCYHEETYKRSTVSCCHTVIDGTDAPTIIEGSENV